MAQLTMAFLSNTVFSLKKYGNYYLEVFSIFLEASWIISYVSVKRFLKLSMHFQEKWNKVHAAVKYSKLIITFIVKTTAVH